MIVAFLTQQETKGKTSDLERTLQDLPKLLRERGEALKEQEREIKKLKATLEREHPTLGKASDVIRLNVGGTRIGARPTPSPRPDTQILVSEAG